MTRKTNKPTADSSGQTEKLQKILANAGFGSRREMEKAIEEGLVTVNGDVAKLGDRAGRADSIIFNGLNSFCLADFYNRLCCSYAKGIGFVCNIDHILTIYFPLMCFIFK